jgi:DNA-binding HxlR family transcriptional regulator
MEAHPAIQATVFGEEELAAPSFRTGERVLKILATPLNFLALRALSVRPMRLAELRQATGLPAQTTLRGHLATLGELGVVGKRATSRMPYAVENELTPMGVEMLEVAEQLEVWLQSSPQAPVSLESGAARGIVKAFVDGWGSTMMRGLAARPMSLTELDRRIPELSYPALERRLSSMRMAGLIEARPSAGSGTPYAATEWARMGSAPLVAAGHCEQVHMRERAAPLTQADIEAGFQLAMPLVGLAETTNGSCQLEVESSPGAAYAEAGVTVRVERGRIVACEPSLGAAPTDFAAGSPAMWFSALSAGTASKLRFGAGHQVAETVVSGLHSALTRR